MSKLDRVNLIRSDIVKNLGIREIKVDSEFLSTKAAECIIDYLIDCIADLEVKFESIVSSDVKFESTVRSEE